MPIRIVADQLQGCGLGSRGRWSPGSQRWKLIAVAAYLR